MTIEDLAEYLKVSTKTVYRMVRKGQLPCYRVGNLWRFRRTVIDQWLEERAMRPVAEAEKVETDESR